MFGSSLRCTKCNQYIPDRCTCNKENDGLVQCKKTGRWYNPQEEWLRTMNSPEVRDIMQRLKDR